MFDSALPFDRYRLEVVRSWPESAVKDKLLASISVLFGGTARAEDTLIRYRCLPRQLPYVMVRVEKLGRLFLGGYPTGQRIGNFE